MDLSNIKQLLTENKAKFQKHGLDKIIEKYQFILISNEDDFYENEDIIFDTKQSAAILINHTKNKQGDQYFIIGANCRLLIINQSILAFIEEFFSINENATIYYLSNLKDIINSKINIENVQMECSEIFLKEISNFNNEFFINSKNISIKRGCYEILSCITGYLIQQGYSKIKNKQNIDSSTSFNFFSMNNKKNLPEIFNEQDYIELRFVGIGASSTVELIYHIEKEEIFAIKKFKDEENGLFEREYNNYLNMNHPFLPKLIGRTENKNYLIIQYIIGQSLDIISEFHFTFKEKIIIIFKLMMIIEYIHQNGFVYRDLKPNNVLIFKENKILYLIDFDRMIKFSDSIDNKQHTADFQSIFVSPEAKLGNISYMNDIYSIGQMIYFIIKEKWPKFERNEKIDENESIHLIFKRCINDRIDERPNITELMFVFYSFFSTEIEKSFLKIQYFSGILNLDLEYIEQDINKSIHYLSIASDLNNSQAQYNLGVIYYKLKNNIFKSLHYFTLAADHNHSESQFFLGLYYSEKEDINKSIHYLTLSAEQNHIRAQHNLALLYYNGELISRNINKSIRYFSLAANQNYLDSQYILGNIYFEGKYLKKDINKAIHYYTLAANQNHSDSQFKLGVIYLMNEDIEKALFYLKMASNQNNLKAQFQLGVIYLTGKYLPSDINQSIYYFTLAANQNDPNSQYNLGKIYYEDQLVKRDINKSIHFLTLAANQNNIQAQYFLGSIYYDNKYVTRNINKAIHYFTLAANSNHEKAQYKLGVIYFKGENTNRDIDKAVHYFTLAANQNNSNASYNLGLFYFDGKYVKKDINKSIYYFTLAANQNEKDAQFNLGVFYYENIFIKRDINKSIHYFTLAANQNYPKALFNLGYIYIENKYIKRDINKSIHYFTLASKLNDKDSQFNLGLIYYENKYVIRDIFKSIYYFSLASDQNDSISQFYLGLIYFEDKYIKCDLIKAIHYLLLASKQNYSKAQYCLGLIYYNNYDINKSIHYYSLSANNNYADAQYNLGVIFSDNIFIERNIEKSIQYFSQAAKQNHSQAQFALAKFYLFGNFIEQNINKGIDLLIQSASNGNVDASFKVGYFYQEGKYIKKDIKKSIHYYKEASSFNNNYAKNNLGVIYKNGFEEEEKIQKNIGLAIEYFNEAIHQKNDKIAMYNLAHIYLYEDLNGDRINDSIDLLIKSVNLSFSPSYILLCFSIIKKYGNDLIKIKKEIDEKSKNSLLSYKTIQLISDERLFDESTFESIYDFYRSINYIYNFNNIIISTDQLNEQNNEIFQKHKTKNISPDFYEGFSIDISNKK